LSFKREKENTQIVNFYKFIILQQKNTKITTYKKKKIGVFGLESEFETVNWS